MKKFFLLLAFCSHLQSVSINPARYMQNRIPTTDGRYPTFYKALNLMTEHNVKIVVETGTARGGTTNFDGDGGSTILFGHWASEHNAHLYSVDIDRHNLAMAQNAVKNYRANITFALNDSVQFLKEFAQQIDFLYLDSWDYDECNPNPAQIHCLHEIQAAYPRLHSNSIIMIDDCNIPGGGKGKLALAWLEEKGWQRITNKHQVILTKK